MKYAIDVRVMEKGMTGIGRYLSDLLNRIPEYDRVNEYFLLSTAPVKNYDPFFYKNIVIDKWKVDNKFYSPVWLNMIIPSFLKKEKFDLFFSPNNLCPMVEISGLKKVIAIHDVMFKYDKGFYSFTYRKYLDYLLKKSVLAADRIITVSEYSKTQIEKYFTASTGKIGVVHMSPDKKFRYRPMNEVPHKLIHDKYNLPETYVLFVGVIENRKNVITILRTSDIVSKTNPEIKFVLAGKPGYGFKEIAPEIQKRAGIVHYIKFVDEEDLPYLYNMAFCLLFTSFYEGFGLPLIEAMQSGLPVISSNCSSLPEVVGNAGILFDPEDALSFASAISGIRNNRGLYQQYVEAVLKQSEMLADKNIALEHLQIFNSVFRQ
jgi:glycosyltransferase involved in cell wall biosynthesis